MSWFWSLLARLGIKPAPRLARRGDCEAEPTRTVLPAELVRPSTPPMQAPPLLHPGPRLHTSEPGSDELAARSRLRDLRGDGR
ncbi:hypothetical protein [Streptomyces malaysiensis]|uniref:hypothetical protein n=1 Tax=Streptomyces malaysiensis TaxID=92644 RepID=UPI0008529960|nr:hypothetical protein [Streptomyces sp. SPMA113]